MSDFEERLGRALVDGAEDAPGPEGLSGGARRRARSRRRRTVSVAVVVVVVAAMAPVAVLLQGGDTSSEPAPVDAAGPTESPTRPPDLWQRVSTAGATFEVPPGWTSPPGCTGAGPAPVHGPGETDARCVEVPGVFVYASATFDPAYGPGVQRCESAGWCGYVIAGPAAVFVRGVERETAQRLLDSVREGAPTPTWQTVSHAGLDLDVPGSWTEQDPAACDREVGYEAGIMVPFSGRDPCAESPLVTVRPDATIDYETGLAGDGGAMRIGDQAVMVRNVDRGTARRILSSVRPAGAPPPDVTAWTSVEEDGVTAEVPVGGTVEVVVRDGVPRCAAIGTQARRVAGDRWAVEHCRNRIVTVLAPTEALAEVVAATIRD